MPEVQGHGFAFEKWILSNFFNNYSGSYGQKWDVPADKNTSNDVPSEYRGMPVSIKAMKYGTGPNLGDVLRQRQINHPFLMIVGFWKQRTPTEKWIEKIGCAKFTLETWSSLWGALTLEHITEIDTVVKNLGEHYTTVREKAQAWKRLNAAKGHILVINPKIDSKIQRRIQCSIPYNEYWKAAGGEANAGPCLWGHNFTNPLLSAPRTFND